MSTITVHRRTLVQHDFSLMAWPPRIPHEPAPSVPVRLRIPDGWRVIYPSQHEPGGLLDTAGRLWSLAEALHRGVVSVIEEATA